MILNHLRFVIRHLLLHKAYSFINIFGLAISFAAFVVVNLYLWDELSYDRHHANAERIYRLHCRYFLPGDAGFEDNAGIGPGPATMIMKDFSEIESVVRIRSWRNELIQIEGSTEKWYEDIAIADSSVFSIFDISFIFGRSEDALAAPFSMIISRSAAKKYFNRENVVGETILMPNDSTRYSITGVIDDIPDQSHFHFDFLASFSSLRRMSVSVENWWNFSYHTYLLMKSGVDMASFSDKIRTISQTYIPEQEKGSGYRQEYSIMPLLDIHLHSDLRGEFEPNGKMSTIYVFVVVGFLILSIACFNFINLSTARSLVRAKEVGLRKVVGAERRVLVRQFLGESILTVMIAGGLAVILLEASLVWINRLLEKNLGLANVAGPVGILVAVGFLLLVGVLAGLYPAFFLANFKSLSMLRGNVKSSSSGQWIRRALVTCQFAMSIGLIAGILLVYQQMNFMREADLGFQKDQVLILDTKGDRQTEAAYQVLKDEMLNVPGVLQTSLSSKVPGKELDNNVVRLGWDENAAWNDMRYLAADHEFANLYGLELVAGRVFDRSFASDENEAFLLNESGVRRLGFNSPVEALGQQLGWKRKKGRVVGVVKDFHWMALQQAIQPFIVVFESRRANYLSIKVAAAESKSVLGRLEEGFRRILPSRAFEFSFLDEAFDQQYRSEERFGQIFLVFTSLALLVGCLGLFGLTAYSAEQRTKEMGVRKILGASVGHIVGLFSKEFVLMIVAANVIAVPVTAWMMSRWLEEFAYRVAITPVAFVIAAVAAMTLALVTISVLAIRAATMNPVKTLRYE